MLIRIIIGVFLIYFGGFLFKEYYKIYSKRKQRSIIIENLENLEEQEKCFDLNHEFIERSNKLEEKLNKETDKIVKNMKKRIENTE